LIRVISALAAVALCLTLGASPARAGDIPPTMLGPGDANVSDIGGKAVIRMSKYGPVYISGQHNSHLRLTYVKDRQIIRFRDTRTGTLRSAPKRCSQEKVKKGISVICTIPKEFREKKRKMFIQVWPRLGSDYVDGRTLPRKFRLWVLTDAGNDVVYGGAGNDFVNGAKGNDRAYGGDGRDWLRGGPGADTLVGGAADDRIAQG